MAPFCVLRHAISRHHALLGQIGALDCFEVRQPKPALGQASGQPVWVWREVAGRRNDHLLRDPRYQSLSKADRGSEHVSASLGQNSQSLWAWSKGSRGLRIIQAAPFRAVTTGLARCASNTVGVLQGKTACQALKTWYEKRNLKYLITPLGCWLHEVRYYHSMPCSSCAAGFSMGHSK